LPISKEPKYATIHVPFSKDVSSLVCFPGGPEKKTNLGNGQLCLLSYHHLIYHYWCSGTFMVSRTHMGMDTLLKLNHIYIRSWFQGHMWAWTQLLKLNPTSAYIYLNYVTPSTFFY